MAESVHRFMLEMVRKLGPIPAWQDQVYRMVVVGTRPAAHRHPGLRRSAESRVTHARARRLYSERLRRDRRRIRKGRKPVLRTGPKIQAMFPRPAASAQEVPPGLGLNVIESPHLDIGRAIVMNASALGRAAAEWPVPEFSEPEPGGWRGHAVHQWIYDEPFNWKGIVP